MFKKRFSNLISVKSIITLVFTAILVVMICVKGIDPAPEIMALYCTQFGVILGSLFYKRKEDEK